MMPCGCKWFYLHILLFVIYPNLFCFICSVKYIKHICFLLFTSTVVFKFELLSTWGDPYYVGLSGIEFYDRNGDKIPLGPNSIL